jgi:hypothetical protein
MNIQNAIDEARSGVPRIPSVDEQMRRVETEPPPEQP